LQNASIVVRVVEYVQEDDIYCALGEVYTTTGRVGEPPVPLVFFSLFFGRFSTFTHLQRRTQRRYSRVDY
jgi:hypothetical protein